MDFLATFSGAAVGVLAGVFIQYLFGLLSASRTTKSQKSAFRKEMAFNKLFSLISRQRQGGLETR
jgi:hypothetical protein